MPRYSVWQGLDRLSFCENAILLDLKARSQGTATRANFRPDDEEVLRVGDLSRQMVRDFLDDLALVAAGNGGKDNVSATCMEVRDQGQVVVLRVAKNEGLDGQTRLSLNDIVQLMTKGITAESELQQRQQEILREILGHCTGRLSKHTQRFTNELRDALCRPSGQYATPMYLPNMDQTEAPQDVQRLGRRCQENHVLYMQACKERLNQLRDLCSELSRSSDGPKLQKLMLLTERAYEVRRSSSFRQFLQSNLQKPKRAEAITSLVDRILERLGKISRFYRAATTLTAVGIKLLNKNMAVQVQGVPAPKFQIEELSDRTPRQLRQRGGYLYASCGLHQMQGMISRWPKYRLHSEMQLLIFYQENPDILPQDGYIGGDKLACYLCHSFIKSHAQFEVKGCHQSLYSLWTVPDVVFFENEGRAEAFRLALRGLCEDLEHKMTAMRDIKTIRRIGTTNNESVANLSRLSLPLVSSMIGNSPTLETTYEDVLLDDQNRFLEGETSDVPPSNLITVSEAPLLEHLPQNNESDQAEQLETSQSLTDRQSEMATLEVDAMGSDPVPTDVVPNCQSSGDDKQPDEALRAKEPSKPLQQHLRPSGGQVRRHVRNPWIEEEVSGPRATKHKKSNVFYQNNTRHRARRKRRSHAEWRSGQLRRCDKDKSRRQGRPKSSFAQRTRSKQSILNRFWLLCNVLVGGCFGESRNSG